MFTSRLTGTAEQPIVIFAFAPAGIALGAAGNGSLTKKVALELRCLPPERHVQSPPAPQLLEFPGGRLHGKLGPSGRANLPFAWQPMGGTKPVALRREALPSLGSFGTYQVMRSNSTSQ